jgi:hypothetical protein
MKTKFSTRTITAYLLLQSLAYFWHYLLRGILTPFAYIFHQSFLLSHPSKLLPVQVASPWNHTIHSFAPSPDIKTHLILNRLISPPERSWLPPQEVQERLEVLPHISRAIILKGRLSGPPLRQGMIALQHGKAIFIKEELGRYPTQDDFISTLSVGIEAQNTFPLFIPVQQVKRDGVRDHSLTSPFRNPITLVEIMRRLPHLKSISPPSGPDDSIV